MQQLQDPSPEVQHAMSYGVPVGRMDRKVFSDTIIADVNRFFTRSNIHVQAMPNQLMSVRMQLVIQIK
jgi:hypothetical protein